MTHLNKVLHAIEDEDLGIAVLSGDEDRLERAKEQPLEIEVSQFLLVHKLERQLFQRVHRVLRDLRILRQNE